MASAARVLLPTESVVLISISSRKMSRLNWRVASSSGAQRRAAASTRKRVNRMSYCMGGWWWYCDPRHATPHAGLDHRAGIGSDLFYSRAVLRQTVGEEHGGVFRFRPLGAVVAGG